MKMITNWVAKQANFGKNGLKVLTGRNDQQSLALAERYRLSSPIAGREIDVERAFGTVGFAAMEDAGISLGVASGPFRELMHYGLGILAQTSLRSGFVGTAEQLDQFLEWFETGNENLDQRRLHEFLEIHERKANRFLVVAGEECFTTNNKDDALERGGHIARKVVDANKIADKLRNYRSDLFTFEPTGPAR